MRRVAQVCCCLACVGVGVIAREVVLENEAMRLVLGDEPRVRIASLLHKASGTELISGSTQRGLFTVILRTRDGKPESFSSDQAGESALTAPEPGKATLSFRHFTNTALEVEVEIGILPDEPLSIWSIRLRSPDRRELSLVRFPTLAAVSQIGGDSSDDVAVLPMLPGALIRDPRSNWKPNESVQMTYPGDMSAQFLAYQDRMAGLFLSGRDRASHPRKIVISKRASHFDVQHEYVLEPMATEAWVCPYPVAVGVTQGNWCDSADLYKRWASKQPWCAKTLVERDDVPEYWKQGPLVHTCAVRTYKDRLQTGSYYPDLREHIRYLREKVEGPVVAMLASWEKNRRWSAGDYFPVFDHDQAKRVIAELREDGTRPFFFLSGLYYTYDNIGVNGGPVSAAAEHMDAYVIDENGEPAEYTLNESNKSGQWKRLSYEICPGSDYSREFCHGIVDDSLALGVSMLQMDQTVRGSAHPCYAKGHRHPSGVGPHLGAEFQALLADMRAYGKAKDADFVLFHEEPHEELIPSLDGFHMREYKERWWYRGKSGAVGIPLFTYLYHEYAIGYGGDSCSLGPRGEAWNTRCHAVNLVSGKTPGSSVWSSPQNLVQSHPSPLAMIRNHCRLLKTRARDHLMLGTMLHPFELEVADQTYRLWTTKGGKGHTEEFVEPSVLTSSWQAPNGRIGHLFVNPTDTPRSLSVAIDTRNRPNRGTYDVDIYTSATDTFAPLWHATALPRTYTAELPPLSVLFLELRPAAD